MLAQTLARAGLHLGTTTVGRILKETPSPQTTDQAESTGRVVTAKRPNHVWHIDLTVVPMGPGMWCAWLPFALPQRWPFCWWVLVTVDHFSRRAMGVSVFATRPDCRAVCSSLGQMLHRVGTTPKYIVCDRDSVFDCDAHAAVDKAERHPPASIRCCRSPWQRRRGGAIHFDTETDASPVAVDPASPSVLPLRVNRHRSVVQ